MLVSFTLGTLVIFGLMSAWSVSMPVYSGPDEASQVTHAAALVRGQLIGALPSGWENPFSIVSVPGTLGNGLVLMHCYKDEPNVPASCAAGVKLSSNPTNSLTYSGRYPPLYYAVTGLPTLVVDSTLAVIWMRLVGALMCSVLLGLAYMAMTVWSRSRILPAGFLCALTPAAIYMGAMVNPNGLEIAAAICLWCAGLILALEHARNPPRGLVVLLAASGCVLTFTRGLSPLWSLLALVAVVVIMGTEKTWRLLTSRRDVQWAALVLVASEILAAIWILVAHSLWLLPNGPQVPANATELQVISQAFGQTWIWLRQMVGVLGWLDTSLPVWTYGAWAVATITLVAIGLRTGQRRTSVVLIGIMSLSFILPAVLELHNARIVHLVWQGRYTLPLAVGIPLLAAASAGIRAGRNDRLRVNITRILLVLLGLAGMLGYFEALRRYAVGASGPIDFLHGPWHPLEGNALAILWYLAATAMLLGMLWHLTIRGDRAAGLRGIEPEPLDAPASRFGNDTNATSDAEVAVTDR
jgi:hypothetical protein